MAKNSKATRFILDVLTLGTSKGRVLVFIVVLLILALAPVSFIEHDVPNLSICKAILKDHCPSAGITRGVSSLLKGNVETALAYNPLSVPVLIVMIGIVLTDIYRLARHNI